MLDWMFASTSERRLLGASSMSGATPWVIAIMSFSIMIISATGLALVSTASVLSSAIESRYAIEVPGGGDRLPALLQAVRSAPGVSSAQAVPESEMRKTLERWLGSAAESADLPVPALINFDLSEGGELAAVHQKVRSISPDARIVAHQGQLAPLLHSLRLLQWVAFGLVLLLGAAAAAAVALAARGALETHRFTIEVMHGIGATDVQLTRLFQRRIAVEALLGSIGGALAAGLVLFAIAASAPFARELLGGPGLSWGDLFILALIPLCLTALATWVARTAVLAALRQSL